MKSDLEKQIRMAIKKSGISVYQLAKDSEIPQPVLSRFVNGQRGINLSTASKIAQTLGLKLVLKKKRG